MSTQDKKTKWQKIKPLWISLAFGYTILNLVGLGIGVNALANVEQFYPTLLDQTNINYHLLWFILVLAVFSNIAFFLYITLTKFIKFKKKEVTG